MIFASLAWPRAAIFPGVLAIAKRSLVMRLTTMSVHCAESITAIKASKGLFHLRVGLGFG